MYTQVYVWVCCSLEIVALCSVLLKLHLKTKRKKEESFKIRYFRKTAFLKRIEAWSIAAVPQGCSLSWITHELQFLKAVPVPEYIGRLQDGQYSCLNLELGDGGWVQIAGEIKKAGKMVLDLKCCLEQFGPVMKLTSCKGKKGGKKMLVRVMQHRLHNHRWISLSVFCMTSDKCS